jgi:hypothetical protein
MDKMPRWADVILVPLINLTLAFFVAGLVVLAIGQNPIDMIYFMVKGALGSTTGIGYTLYYATNFIFTGLAFAVAMHARLFNIGGEGQAAVGGLGATIVLLAVPWPHWTLALPFAILGGAVFGAAWAAIPAYLQAKRGSHIVITTIMFNFIGAALIGYLLNGLLKDPTTQNAETRNFGAGNSGLFAGQARQPYRDYHDHVQLYRRGTDRLSAERPAERPDHAERRNPKFRRRRALADFPRNAGALWHRVFQIGTRQHQLYPGHCCRFWRLDINLAHPVGLSDPGLRPKRSGSEICRHLFCQGHHYRDAH